MMLMHVGLIDQLRIMNVEGGGSVGKQNERRMSVVVVDGGRESKREKNGYVADFFCLQGLHVFINRIV
jgi:hypothetical protein